MGRLQRVYSATGCYHIMLRGNERMCIFTDNEDRDRFLEILTKKKAEMGFSIYAFCLMNNHIHMVLQEGKNSISKIMKGIATSYAMFFNYKYERVGHVFQGRFKSEPIEDERYLLAVIRYIHNNSVKAGLADSIEQYRWSSYRYYIEPVIIEPALVDTGFILEIISNDPVKATEEFKRFSTQRDENQYHYMEDIEGIRTLEEGKAYLEEYLEKNWSGINIVELMKDTAIRNQIIADLRMNTHLSVRKIADLLGINRGMVQTVGTIHKSKNI